MEFFDKALGFKKRKQEKFLGKLDLGEKRISEGDFVGPNYKEGDVVNVQPDQFLKIVKKKDVNQITAKQGRGSDTHIPYNVFAEIDDNTKLHIKATASVPQWHKSQNPNQHQTLLIKLEEIGFQKDPSQSKESWSVYKKD